MKYLYEWNFYKNKQNTPIKGDYVLLQFPTSYGYSKEFFDNNIGQIIKKRGNDYIVKFDKNWLNNTEFEILKKTAEFEQIAKSAGFENTFKDTAKIIKKAKDNTMDIVGSDIKYYNKNKEELEKHIDVYKYNL